MSGRLSYQWIDCKQAPQREPGQSRLFSRGKRAMATFRKLPTQAPTTNTNDSINTRIMLEVYENAWPFSRNAAGVRDLPCAVSRTPAALRLNVGEPCGDGCRNLLRRPLRRVHGEMLTRFVQRRAYPQHFLDLRETALNEIGPALRRRPILLQSQPKNLGGRLEPHHGPLFEQRAVFGLEDDAAAGGDHVIV